MKNEEYENVTLKELIDKTTMDIRRNLKYVISEGEVREFKKYLEDAAIFQTVVDIKGDVVTEGNSRYTSTNVASALIASNIRRDGLLNSGEKIGSYVSNLGQENLLYAKRRALELEKEYLGASFEETLNEVKKEIKESPNIIDPGKLVKLGVCLHDRNSGYVENLNGKNDKLIKEAKELWKAEKAKYIVNNQVDTPYFEILSYIYDEDEYIHFPLITKELLEKTASYTYGLDLDEVRAFSSYQKFEELNVASSLIFMDVIESFRESIDKTVDAYDERRTAKVKKLNYNK